MKSTIQILTILLLLIYSGSFALAERETSTLKAGAEPPDFEIKTLDDYNFKLSRFKDRLPILVDIWATWCPPCREEMPVLQKLYDQYPAEFEIIAISIDPEKDAEKITDFVDEYDLAFWVAHDTNMDVADKFNTRFVPSLIVVGKDGKILDSFEGYNTELTNRLKEILKLKDPVTADDYVDRGYAYYDRRDELDRAKLDFEKAIEMDPINSRARCGRGEIKFDQGDREGAIIDLDRAIELSKTNARAFYNRGMVEEKAKNYDKALEFYNTGLEFNPEDFTLDYYREKLENKLKVLNKPAPDFTVTTLEGEEITLSDFKGEKAVIIDRWATWCGPCRLEMPKLQELYDKHSDKVEIIASTTEEELDTIKEFLSDKGYTFKIVQDVTGVIKDNYVTRGIPFLTIIDKDGIIIETVTGYNPEIVDELEEILGL